MGDRRRRRGARRPVVDARMRGISATGAISASAPDLGRGDRVHHPQQPGSSGSSRRAYSSGRWRHPAAGGGAARARRRGSVSTPCLHRALEQPIVQALPRPVADQVADIDALLLLDHRSTLSSSGSSVGLGAGHCDPAALPPASGLWGHRDAFLRAQLDQQRHAECRPKGHWSGARRHLNVERSRFRVHRRLRILQDCRVLLIPVQMPNRPGALGAVASALGAIGADISLVEIVEKRRDRGGQRLHRGQLQRRFAFHRSRTTGTTTD